MSNKAEVIELMSMMALAWPRYELKKETFEVYYQILKDVPIEALTEAAKALMATATFFPAISEWRNAAFDILIHRMKVPSQFEAWEEAYAKMVSIGHGPTPEFSHPLIRRAVDCIGWNYLCMSEQIEFERPHFYKVYESFLQRANEEIRMLPDVKRAIEAGDQPTDVSKAISLLTKGMVYEHTR